MFQDMLKHVRRDVIHHLFHINLEHFDSHGIEERREKELEQLNMVSSDDTGDAHVEQRRVDEKIGRNDPCTCGSGKKYKKCCMK